MPRPTAAGVFGIARDLAARGLGTLKTRDYMPVEGQYDSPIKVSIDDDTLDGCPLFTGRMIRGVQNGPSPKWLQDRLNAIGLRPISALVDITNFFTFDQNRPLHVFDAAKVTGNLRIHRAEGGEELLALDEKTYTMQPGQMVISDDNGAESIAGIMGGEETGCTEETVDVFLESAFWDHVQIALTGRALKINSDARFISFEPLLGPIGEVDLTSVAWAIVGGESGPGARPMEAAWATELRVACERYEVAFFFKQWGGARPKSGGRLLEGEEWNGFPWQIVPKAIMAELQ